MINFENRQSSLECHYFMNIRSRLSSDETRLRIMEVAEEHFRRIGYAKTAVADIASRARHVPGQRLPLL